MRPSILLLALLASGCATVQPVPFEPTRNEQSFQLEVREFDSLTKLSETCQRLGAAVGRTEVGCAAFNPNTKQCTVYVLSLSSSEARDQMWVWGHEVAHCKYGRYHTVAGR